MATSAPNFPTFAKGQGRMARQFIYHMQGLSKTFPANRKVLEKRMLSFDRIVKTVVRGDDGYGLSTWLRVVAGIDNDYVRDGWVVEHARVADQVRARPLHPATAVREVDKRRVAT